MTQSKPTQKEWFTVGLVTIALASVLLFPYLLGHLAAPADQFYTHLIMNPEDAQTYWAKMQQGNNGRFLYTIPFTPEPHDGALVGLFYVLLGQAARVTGLSLTAVWHLSRSLAGVLLFLTIFAFVAAFTRSRTARWTAFLLALFGSGLGWLLLLAQQPYWLDAFPVDFKQPGAHIFFTALTFPHIAVATAAILGAVWSLWQLGNSPSVNRIPITDYRLLITVLTLANLCNLVISITYPFLIYLVFATAVFYGLHLCWRERRLLWGVGFRFAATFLLALPLNLYYAWVLSQNPVFRAWSDQSVTLSPPWPHFFIAFGPYLLLAGLYWWKRPFAHKRPSARSDTAILWAWIFAAALLVYAPLNPQRRFVQGVHVPLSILSALAVVHLVLPWLEKTAVWQKLIALPRYETGRLRRFLLVLFLLLMSLGNLYLWLDVTRTAVLVQPDPLFRPRSELVAANWLHENSPETAVILADYQTGSLVAARTGRRVMLGHWSETMDFAAKEALAARFFAADTPGAWRKEMLNDYGVSFVWHGPRERALGDFDPDTASYLTAVFRSGDITLYAVLINTDQSPTIQ